MSERRHPNVVHESEVQAQESKTGTRFGFKSRRLGAATGARGIGCSVYEVEPGRTAFPAHYHCANEEAIYVLSGTGTLRLGDEKVELRAGDFVTLLTGPEHPHQLVATGSETLRYLCMSTLITTEVVGYPDSKKIAAVHMESPTAWPAKLRVIFKEDSQVQYFDGERTD